MKAQLRVLTGSQAGHTEVFGKPYVGVGRHPASDLRFDPERDLEVSARHAALMQQGGAWYVRDLGSRNGTFVNGHRIAADTKLDDTDQLRFGTDGPMVEFRLVPDSTPDGVVAPAARASGAQVTAPAREAARDTTAHPSAAGSTTQRIRAEVMRQTRRHRSLTVTLVVLLAAGLGAFALYTRQQSVARERERAALQARTDSILRAADAAISQLQGQVEGLANTLAQSQSRVERLQAELAQARRAGDQTLASQLERRLSDATQTLSYQQAAAMVDYRSIVDGNQQAVVMITVKFGPTDVQSGTGFAVSSDGTIITNRHVVAGADGTRRPLELGVQFADSDQFFPARLVAISPDADLAVIRVTIRGGVPAVRGINQRPDTLRQGDPVAIIGFPHGTDLVMDMSERNRPIARTTFAAGSVSKVLANNLQIDGYSAVGGSGSPIFDRAGSVVGVLYGSPQGTGGRVIYAVPSSYVLRLLEAAGR